MALRDFDHVRAASLTEADSLAVSRRGEAVYVAGGTDLLGLLKDRVHRLYPKLLIDLKGISDLAFVREDEKGVRIGALTSLAEIAASPITLGTPPRKCSK